MHTSISLHLQLSPTPSTSLRRCSLRGRGCSTPPSGAIAPCRRVPCEHPFRSAARGGHAKGMVGSEGMVQVPVPPKGLVLVSISAPHTAPAWRASAARAATSSAELGFARFSWATRGQISGRSREPVHASRKAVRRARAQPGWPSAPAAQGPAPAWITPTAHDERRRAAARGVQAPHQNANRAAQRRDRGHAALGVAGFGPDHHRKVDGWQSLGQPPSNSTIDLAA